MKYSKLFTLDSNLYAELYDGTSIIKKIYNADDISISYKESDSNGSKTLKVYSIRFNTTLLHIEFNELNKPLVYGSSVNGFMGINECHDALVAWKTAYQATGCYSGVINGSTWLNGEGSPSDVLGINGDYYLDTDTDNIYQKIVGIWSLIGNIKGERGQDGVSGATWHNGEGAPGAVGSNGDYYLDILSSDIYVKNLGAWSFLINIKGADGSGIVVTQLENLAAFPVTGDPLKIYIDLSTRLMYYWDGSEYVKEGSFGSNFTVYLDQSNGRKTFMKWENQAVVPAAGKHPSELLLEGAIEAIPPNATLSSPTTIAFNQTAISNVLNFTKSVNLPGTSISSVSLEFRRNGSGVWSVISTDTGITTYTHVYTDSAYNTDSFDYRYIVTDNLGGTVTKTVLIPIAAYVAPTISFSASQGVTRELGNTVSNFSGTITRNSVNVLLSSYIIEYRINGSGAWIEIGTSTSISGASPSISVTHSDEGLSSATSLVFRVKVIDGYQTTYSSSYTVSLYLRSVLGYSQNNSLSLSDITAISTNIALTNSKSRTISGVSAASDEYTYYVYASSAGDLSNVIMDGATSVIGAFTKLSDVAGTNAYGASVTYRVYKSNSLNAFASNSLIFS